MKTVTAIYTGQALLGPLNEYFKAQYPNHRLVNILDDSLISSVISAGELTPEVLRKIYTICREACLSGTDLILQTCSSVGESAHLIQPFFNIPILRIDRPMIEQAVGSFSRIAVLATLPSTLTPTINLVKRISSEQSKSVQTVEGLAKGAFQALSAGDPEAHDTMILDTAMKLTDSCDAFLLAQGSMARMAETLASRTGNPVFTSPESGIDSLRPYLES